MKQTTRRNSLLLVVVAVALAIGAVLVSIERSKTEASEQPLRLRLSSFGLNLNPLALADTESRRVATLLHLGLVRVANDIERRQGLDCLRCGGVVEPKGTWAIRTGGSSGGITAFFGGLAELSEGTVDLDVTVCPTCGHVEFRAPRG